MKENTEKLLPKLAIIGFIMVLCYFSSLFVLGLVHERSDRNLEAARDVAARHGKAQTLNGPILALEVIDVQTQKPITYYLLPEDVDYDVAIDVTEKTRGKFTVPVYTSTITGTGSFDLDSIQELPNVPATAIVGMSLVDTRGLSSSTKLVWNENEYDTHPGTKMRTLQGAGLHSVVPLSAKQNTYDFSFEFEVHGSESFEIIPLATQTNATLTSNWVDPSFIGSTLPDHTLDEAGFVATYSTSAYERAIPQYWKEGQLNPDYFYQQQQTAFGVKLIEEVNFYTLVDRVVKYAILFIALTFLTFFMFETLAGLRVHPIQYLLVGLALALFYLLLLAFAEHIGFLSAYLTATAMTVGLITLYAMSVLRQKKRAAIIFGLLTSLYGYLYLLLQMEAYSLLAGSIFLFLVLAIVMFITRNIDWYGVKRTE